MVTYKEYLLDMITESTAGDNVKDVLVETVLEATEVSQLDYVEDFLEAAKADDLTLKEKQDASGASTARKDGKNAGSEYDIEGYTAAEKRYEEGLKLIEEGEIEKGAKICGEASRKAYTIIGKAAQKLYDSDDIEKELNVLIEVCNEFDKKCKSGDITASDAKTLGNKILVKIKLVGKKVKAAFSKLKEKITKEDALDAVFEGAASGYMSDKDLEFLSEALI